MNNIYEKERLTYFKEQKSIYKNRLDVAMKNTDNFDVINKYGKEYGYYSDIVKMLEEQMK
jgi:hypothetical protein